MVTLCKSAMYLHTLLVFSSGVLLASNASVLSNDTVTVTAGPTTAFRGFSFAAKATPNANKGSSDNHTLENDSNMQVRRLASTLSHGRHSLPINLKYAGKVNVGGFDFTLIIDTGSSDLWISGNQKPKLNHSTNTTVNLTYGIGSALGKIEYAPVSFGGYQVDNQAFLSVLKTKDQGSEGILGLGLNGLSALERTTKDASAQSVMANIFTQHPSTPHFLGLALERSDGGEETAGGFLTIGEYDPHYSNITYMPKIPVAPTSASRWTVAMEAMTINGKRFPLKSGVKGTKKDQAITLIDSGTSLAYIPSDAVDAIYSQFSGSVHVQTSNQDTWFVPCLEQVNLSFSFTGATYPINPMELSSPVRVTDQKDQYTVCVNAFRPPLNKQTEHELDFLLGDIFMRNVYSVFNFANGSTMHGDANADAKGASIQLLSRTNRDQVYADFENSRKESLKAQAPLFDLRKLHTDGTTDGGGRLEPPSSD
ncbi:aspartic peptidase domain-containing protein [Chiua virens]|nr:aspartic peptidase domain-containing protein [Chiua virens]